MGKDLTALKVDDAGASIEKHRVRVPIRRCGSDARIGGGDAQDRRDGPVARNSALIFRFAAFPGNRSADPARELVDETLLVALPHLSVPPIPYAPGSDVPPVPTVLRDEFGRDRVLAECGAPVRAAIVPERVPLGARQRTLLGDVLLE